MMARCSAWRSMSTGCARPNGSWTGCSPQPLDSTSRSRKSRPRLPRWPCRDRPRMPCSGNWASPASSVSSRFSSDISQAGELRVMVSRTGFTGDLGYELWVDPQQAGALWDGLMSAGRSRGIRPIGSQALNIARIEAGFLLPKVDFVSAEASIRLGTSRSPLELGLAWLVDFNKGHFTGRRALLEQQRRGLRAAAGRSRHRRQQAGGALRCCTRMPTASGKSAASVRRSGRQLASAILRLLWSRHRTSPAARRYGPKST